MSEKSTGGEEASHANIWGTVDQAEDTVGAKALRHTALGVLEGQRGGQCGWSRLSTGRMRGQSDGVGSGHAGLAVHWKDTGFILSETKPLGGFEQRGGLI